MTDKQIIIEDCPYFIGGNCQEYLDGVCENHKCDLKIIRELEQQLKAKEQKLKKIEEFRHNYCMNCEDLLKPSHSCKGCNMVELKHLIEGKENG